MSRNQSVDYFQKLCSLGLPGPSVAPALLETLHRIIPAEANSIAWRDTWGRTNRILVENIRGEVPLQPVYRDSTAEARAREVLAGCVDTIHGHWENGLPDGTLTGDNGDNPGPAQEAGNGPAVTGFVCSICRSTRFNRSEQHTLNALLPHLARALGEPDIGPAPLVASGREGFLLADSRGVVHHISPDAMQLLCRAQLYTPQRERRPTLSKSPLSTGLAQLVGKRAGNSDDPASRVPPVWRHRMPWGTFVFRNQGPAQCPPLRRPLSPPVPTQPLAFEMVRAQPITIHLCVLEPLPIKLLWQLRQSPLSSRQREIALWLAQGFSLDNIGRQLHIGEGATAAYTRAIYERLNVRNRAELARRLLA